MKNNLFVPPFLRKIDNYLLYNYPIIWATRLHYVMWYILLWWLLALLAAYILKSVRFDFSFYGTYHGFVSIIAILIMVFWLNHYRRYNAMKHLGKRVQYRELINVVSTYICIALISSTILAFPFFRFQIALHDNNTQTTIEDLNKLNLASGFLPSSEYDVNKEYAPSDTNQTKVVRLRLSARSPFSDWRLHDMRLTNFDNDSIIQNKFEKLIGKKEQILKVIDDYRGVLLKYGYNYKLTNAQLLSFFDVNTFTYNRNIEFEEYNQDLYYKINSKIDVELASITELDYIADSNFLFGWFICFLPLILLFITIYNNTKLPFYLSAIGVTILVFIFSITLLVSLDSLISGNKKFITIFLFYISIWLVMMFRYIMPIYNQKTYRWISQYALVLFNVILPILPLIYVMGYMELSHNGYYNGEKYFKELIFIGFILTVLAQQFFFKPLYERLWAMPRKT